MIYNPEKPIDVERAVAKLRYYVQNKKVFELIEKRTAKTYPQLKYVHLIMGWFAWEYGEKLEYIKLEYFKKIVNPDIFVYEFENRKTGEVRTEYRSLADITKDQMTLAIDRFRTFSSKHAGIYLPEPNDLALLREVEIQIENNKEYL